MNAKEKAPTREATRAEAGQEKRKSVAAFLMPILPQLASTVKNKGW